MVLSTTKRTSSMSSITNGQQGGGSKKAGFPYQVGRTTSTSIAFGLTDIAHGNCCKLSSFQLNLYPNARPSRPVGSIGIAGYRYYHIPGTA
jgi:hypothetical protein